MNRVYVTCGMYSVYLFNMLRRNLILLEVQKQRLVVNTSRFKHFEIKIEAHFLRTKTTKLVLEVLCYENRTISQDIVITQCASLHCVNVSTRTRSIPFHPSY